LSGKPYFLESPSIVASNGVMHKELIEVLDQASSKT
jgi:hypothetical protein